MIKALQSAAARTGLASWLGMTLPVVLLLATLLFPASANASESRAYPVNMQTQLIGSMGTYTVRTNESLYEIARTYKTGYNDIVAANPDVDPFVPVAGTRLVLPTAWILPDAGREPGIVINVSEFRLYYYFKKKGRTFVRMYPIGIGDDGFDTPLGTFKIVEKIRHPAWYVPQSIRKEKPELPAVVPPGPDNPMGSHALRLSSKNVLIHGTDTPWGIGKRVSHGCIRLYPEDIVELFHLVPLKTRVTILQQPVRAGVSNGRIYVEVNADDSLKGYDYSRQAGILLQKKGLLDRVNRTRLMRAVREKKGFPVDVTL
jgi:L,D-transpeptidase ErfK/SrfK